MPGTRTDLIVHQIASRLAAIFPAQSDNEKLLHEQWSVHSHLVPLLYFTLIANSWGLAVAFFGSAPALLTIAVPVGFTIVSCVRVAMWWHRRHVRLTTAQIRKEQLRTTVTAIILGCAVCAWSLALFPHGDAYQKAHVAYYLAITILACMLCLTHLRPAMLSVTAIGGAAFLGYFAFSGILSLVIMATSFFPVIIATAVIGLIQNRDFARMVDARERVSHLAHYDMLTGLPNRASFNDELERRLATPGNPIGLLYIDLDGFKLVNDTRGHGIGDLLLVEVAKRLHAACDAPAMFVSRLGGDEFAVLLPHGDVEKAKVHADRIIEAVSASYEFGHGNIKIGASIGIALAPQHGDTAENLLARSDIALYAAKEAGKGNARLFTPSMEIRIQERARLEEALRETLQDRENLFVFYQPIVSIATGEITAREALVRWHHPLRGWISPGEFVPVAEQFGLADALGAFVLETACREAAGWGDRARIAVNISATQLGRGTLHGYVLAALVASGLPPNRLELEITETALLDNERDIIGELRRIRGLGVRIALDDFGTGYSSLAHLRAFPFDKIKIDGSFVKDAVGRPDCAAVVRAITDLGKRLGVTTVAEGVETEEQLNCLRNEGCVEVQGYLFGRPVPSSKDAPRIERINRESKNKEAA